MTLAEFKIMFPELVAYDDSYLQLNLDLALKMISFDAFGDLSDAAQGYLAAHLITLDDNALATSQSVGGMSVSYSQGEDNSHYTMTAYGRFYVRLMRTYGVGAAIV